jgi:hypothetical protein
VQIRGRGFTEARGVLFGVRPAEFRVIADDRVTATVPATQVPGHVQVLVVDEHDQESNSVRFQYT